MTVKITQRIKGFKVVDETLERPATATSGSDGTASKAVNVVEMDESLQRPETLIGMTYKIKSPLFEHALYVTVNDIVLNAGTPHEQRRPFEIFINSKNMDHFQWIVALTRIMSAVFRKGGDCTFLVEELKAVFDPRGGYLKKGGHRHARRPCAGRNPAQIPGREARRLRSQPGCGGGGAGRRLPGRRAAV